MAINNYSSSPNGLGLMGYLLRVHGGERKRNNCFSKIQLVGQKYPDKTTLAIVKARLQSFFAPQKPALFATNRL